MKAILFLLVTITLSPFYFFILMVLFIWRQSVGPEIVRFYSKIILLIFRVKIDKVKKNRTLKKGRKGFVIISNHSSFLDIFVLSALFGSVFVSKEEIKYYPIIGQIAWLIGVIFIDRELAKERLRVINTIANKYYGRIITVFPQGTTGRITDHLSFKRGIFKVLELNPDMTLLPVTLFYKKDSEIAWHNPQSFKENAMLVAAQKRISVKVVIHDPVTINDLKGKTAAEVCKIVEQTVLEPLHKNY